MLCYYCEKTPPPGGVRYGIRQAVGTCHECGVGVCAEHGRKQAGQPLFCTECLELRRTRAGSELRSVSQPASAAGTM
jgi:hypothetical protein